MGSRNRSLFAAVCALSLGIPGIAAAQPSDGSAPAEEPSGTSGTTETSEPSGSAASEGGERLGPAGEPMPVVVADEYPLAYTQRPLNLRGGMIRLDGQFHLVGTTTYVVTGSTLTTEHDTSAILDIGLGVGLTDSFEIGVTSYRLASTQYYAAGAVPLTLSPNTSFGDIGIYGRYGLVDNADFGLSLESTLIIPTDSDRNFHFRGGVPLRARLAPHFNIDAAFEVDFSFAEDSDGNPATPGTSTKVSMLIPVAGVLQLAPQVWLAGRSGVYLWNFDLNLFTIPLELELGYTIGDGSHPYLDIAVTGGFPRMLQPGSDGDKFRSDLWHVGLTLNGYFQL